MDKTGAIMTRFFGSFFVGSVLMALYIMFLIGIYSIKINKLGHTEKTSIEGIIAPGVLMILSAILIYGLADKIYT